MTADERTRLLEDSVEEGADNVVSWDGPGDPEHPQNWPRPRAWAHVALVSVLSFLV